MNVSNTFQIFDTDAQVIESSHPTPGMTGVTVSLSNGATYPNLMEYDSKSRLVHFKEEDVDAVLHQVKRSEGGAVSVALSITDFVIAVVKRLRGMFGGSYSGSFGYGQLGSTLAIVSTALFIVAFMAAAVVLVPLSIGAYFLRAKVNKEVQAERQHTINAILTYFYDMEDFSKEAQVNQVTTGR